ncbi:MAG: ATP-binding protein, partial [Pseudomonadota bacterium]|nr:ATP-binding protein [Pseudomonadota bacterium]
DVQMPGMNGFELAEIMRSTEKTRNIPIVFVTAAGKESNYAFKGYETGAVDFLYKPLDTEAVRSKVNVFVELHLQRNETRRQVQALEISREEQEVLVQELQAAEAELKVAVRMRDDFMSMVAHELRTPLNTLFLDAQLRKMQLDLGNTAMFDAAYLQKMVARDKLQVQNMVRLIDDMLDVTRLRNNRLSIRPSDVNLPVLLERVVGNLANQAASAGCAITLHATQPVIGFWDEFRIEQVLINLLTNALRYGKGQPVDVRMTPLPDGVRIDVRDGGCGISVADQKRIFGQFERATSREGDHTGGLGLGLYITRQLVHAHGGSIEVASQPDHGSVFTVLLPLRPPVEPALAAD